jgi:PAS domain S-box-containing protein
VDVALEGEKTGSRVSILLVDDREENRLALKAILSSPDYRLVEASSGSEALRRLLDEDFALLLLDVLMPGMSGFELASAIKQRDRTADLPILFLTAQATDVEHVYKGYRVGAVDYLVKPLVPEMVRAKVAVFAELHRQRKRIAQQGVALVEAERKESQLRLLELRLANERQFKATLDAILDAILIFAPGSLYPLYVNQGARALWGYGAEELARMRPFELMTGYDERRFRELLAPMQEAAQGMITLEARSRRKDATEIPVEFSFQLVQVDGGHIVSIARDITERKLAELEREHLYEEAVAAVRARDEFLSVASHELRTPLSSLKLQLELLARPPRKAREAPELPEPVREKLAAATRHVDRLARLVTELMDVSRLTAGRLRLELEQVELAALCRDVVGRFKADAAKAGCEVTLTEGEKAPGRWDRLRLEQVVTNLLANALKYGAGKPVELEVDRDGAQARLVVRDHGIGIPPEDTERVFRQFERTDSAQRYSGLGLGLYIVRQIVEAHGGTIRVESRLGEGSKFTVKLPPEPPAEGPSERTPEERSIAERGDEAEC